MMLPLQGGLLIFTAMLGTCNDEPAFTCDVNFNAIALQRNSNIESSRVCGRQELSLAL